MENSNYQFVIPVWETDEIVDGEPCKYIESRDQGSLRCQNCCYNSTRFRSSGTFFQACAFRHYGDKHLERTMQIRHVINKANKSKK